MYSTAISNVDLVVRQSIDMLWLASDRVRMWSKNDIRKICYFLLLCFVIWGLSYANRSVSLIVLAFSANIANFTMALSAVLTIIGNPKFLPEEFGGSFFRELCLLPISSSSGSSSRSSSG